MSTAFLPVSPTVSIAIFSWRLFNLYSSVLFGGHRLSVVQSSEVVRISRLKTYIMP